MMVGGAGGSEGRDETEGGGGYNCLVAYSAGGCGAANITPPEVEAVVGGGKCECCTAQRWVGVSTLNRSNQELPPPLLLVPTANPALCSRFIAAAAVVRPHSIQ